MPPRPRAPKRRRPNFDNPEMFPLEVRAHVAAINATRELISKYESLFEELPSFGPLLNGFDDLKGAMDDISEYIEAYLSEDDELDFKSFEFDMSHLLADGLESTLDYIPIDMRGIKNPSPLEDQFFSDVESVMERVWVKVREHGYKLHTAMIGA